jgi:hypothetical protein
MQVNSRFIENYQKGRKLGNRPGITRDNNLVAEATTGNSEGPAAQLRYTRDNRLGFFSAAANQDIKNNLGGFISQTNRDDETGWGTEGKLGYNNTQGLTGSILASRNFQLGNDNLRQGEGKLNIMPYYGAEVSSKGFAGGENSPYAGSTVDAYGNREGIWRGGLNVNGEYRLLNNRKYGNLSLTGGVDLHQTGRYGYAGPGSSGDFTKVLPKPSVNANVGLKYNFKNGGVLLYKK